MDTDTQFQQVYLGLLMLQHGSTSSWNPTTSGDRDRNPCPPGEARPPCAEHLKRYQQATNELAKQRVLHEAREFLERWRGHGIERHAAETQDARDARMVVEGETWTLDEVARAFHCTKSRVRRACDQHGVEIDYQDRLCKAGAVTRAQLVVTMTEANVPQDQIAKQLGISQPTVSRLWKTAQRQAA